MTKIEFFNDSSEKLTGFHVYGHTGFAYTGEDVVCAAISSAVIMVMNTVTDVMHISADVSAEDGDAVMKISSENAGACQSILQGLKLHLLELEKQYSDFIEVKFTEV